ncbi:LysR family transcriptional regulator [Streptomyces sp. NPDC101181]
MRNSRYLLAVAREGTFRGAASRMGMTQLALSRAIYCVVDGETQLDEVRA